MEVNFLPGDDLENRPGGKFLTWSLSWGKRIIVITELVVISAFLSRFYFDTVVADQVEKITQKKAIIDGLSDFEKKYRIVAGQIEQADKIEKQVSSVNVYMKSYKLVPANVILGQFSANQKNVSMGGSCDEVTLVKLVSAFKDSPDFANVTVDRIAKKGDSGIDFAFRADYVGK